MTVHFAYGSNMSRGLMRQRCPTALAIGTAMLRNWRFAIMREGFATIVPAPGDVVHGVLWRLGVRDLAAINAYESLDSGLYVRRTFPVRHQERTLQALVYVSGRRGEGMPKAGYMALIVDAAREWQMPARYIDTLRRRAPISRTARWKDTGEVG